MQQQMLALLKSTTAPTWQRNAFLNKAPDSPNCDNTGITGASILLLPAAHVAVSPPTHALLESAHVNVAIALLLVGSAIALNWDAMKTASVKHFVNAQSADSVKEGQTSENVKERETEKKKVGKLDHT